MGTGPDISLHVHQAKALRELKNGCILTGGVGTGKTITSLAYWYMRVCGGVPMWKGLTPQPMKNPKDVYVFTTARKRNDLDWEEEALNFRIGTIPNEQGVRIHVDSWNNIGKYTDIEGSFVIFDEQRLVGSGSWVKAFLKIAQSNEWIVLSATPGDVWLDYCPIFIANGFYRNRTDFIRRHVVYNNYGGFPKVERYTETAHLSRLRDRVLVDMPYTRHTRRHIRNTVVSYDQELFDRVYKDRWHPYEDRPLRNAAEMFLVMRKVVNSDISRLGAIMQILENHPKLIIFYNFDYELEILRTLRTSLNYEVAEWNGHKHQPVPEGDKWIYLVQYTAGSEAWNCTSTDAMAFYSLNYSYKVFMQSQGRIDRMNTKFRDLHYYVLHSNAMIDKAIRRSLLEKKNFNEKSLKLGDKFVQSDSDPETKLASDSL